MGRQDRFGGWRLVARRAVRADGVVVLSPAFDQDLCLLQAVEDLSAQKLVPELAVAPKQGRAAEPLNVSVRPPIGPLDRSPRLTPR